MLEPISHDGVVRGTLRWTVRDTTYTANVLNGQLSNHAVLLSGLYAPAFTGPTPYAQARELSFALPEFWHQQALFHGVGTYPLGTQDYPWAQYKYFGVGGGPVPATYITPGTGPPVGAVTLTRFDAQAGVITGTVDFVADGRTVRGRAAVTQGYFDLTF